MAKQRHLTKTPITEALIDFRVKLRAGFSITELDSLKGELHDRYPNMDVVRRFGGGFKVYDGKVEPIIEDTQIHGYLFKSDDGKHIVQFRQDGFTFNRLSPYTDWTTVSTEAESLWKVYLAKTPVELITRIAVRYINRLDIPLPILDLAEYFTEPPRIPNTLTQELRHFLTRFVVLDRELDATANITQALQASETPDHVVIIFDIDVYKSKESGFDVVSISGILEQLRPLKNKIFFDSITEKTARLFE